jgi:hypothetical protein
LGIDASNATGWCMEIETVHVLKEAGFHERLKAVNAA